MSFSISLQSEVLKTKRSASFWLSILAAAFMPVILFLALFFEPEGAVKELQANPWGTFFKWAYMPLSAFIFPMFVILICTLIPQIEYKNNAWKQVFASPQSLGNIFFSKFLTIHLIMFFFYLLFTGFMILSGLLTNVLNDQFTFLQNSIDWNNMARLATKTYISILGISAIQYCLSLRFKNFIAPVGIGLALMVLSIVAMNVHWRHIAKLPFAYPFLTTQSIEHKNRPFLENHELNSIGYFAAFLLIGFLDARFRKEKG
jgi:hypothetical protein